MVKSGLFIGMVTLDLVYLTAKLPGNNEKIAASDYTVSAGGPATNAAVTFAHLGNQVTLLSVVGIHPITQLIRSDVESGGVKIADLAPGNTQPPPVSSIIVTQATGERAVVSLNSSKIQVSREQLPSDILSGVEIVMIDGHQMGVSCAIAQLAKANNIPVVIDGGSWKPGFETVLPFVDYAVCSANFYPPGCNSQEAVFAYLQKIGIPHIAITQGEKPIQYLSLGLAGQLPVAQISAVDTLGAGDIFHGAFCHYILRHNFIEALRAATKIASHSCQFFGTRHWMRSADNGL
ncbi:PfkB family carbohydrate kinase [Lyngbya aestuarii]|uniref:PfkB family carbohydrate kinase n=1 Tax=Lyngbya aestuarii TaxID=118322 RepID=UPI00403DB1E4